MSKVIIATLKQDLTRAYALLKGSRFLCSSRNLFVYSWRLFTGCRWSFIYLSKRTCISSCFIKSRCSDCKKVHLKAGLDKPNFEDNSKDRDLLVKELRKESPMLLAVDDFICIAIYVLMFIAITVYCRFCKIKAAETVSGLTLFSVMFWLFFFSDAFVRWVGQKKSSKSRAR